MGNYFILINSNEKEEGEVWEMRTIEVLYKDIRISSELIQQMGQTLPNGAQLEFF